MSAQNGPFAAWYKIHHAEEQANALGHPKQRKFKRH